MAGSARHIVDFVLLGPTHDRRQLQDSPILGDVWAEFAARPDRRVDLLISPYRTEASGRVARQISDRVTELGMAAAEGEEANVAYLQGIVAARLCFSEVLRAIVPMTRWWEDRRLAEKPEAYKATRRLEEVIDKVVAWGRAEDPEEKGRLAIKCAAFTALDRYVALAALILLAGRSAGTRANRGVGGLLEGQVDVSEAVAVLQEELDGLLAATDRPMVWQVSLNRTAMPALQKSVQAVKADAARSLFDVKCGDIAWAVLDSGIDATHPALRDAQGNSRVVESYDFSTIREVVRLDNSHLDLDNPAHRKRVTRLLRRKRPSRRQLGQAADKLRALADDADNDRPIDWEQAAEFVRVAADTPPHTGHGTHVAGIIGAGGEDPDYHGGMCPDIKLYDFRVLGRTLHETEFAIIAALQFIRYLNERHSYITIHGANLSLSIPHDVRNFACGRTPICDECERLVNSGVVVVAAAGNLGYHSFETRDGSYEGYTAFSITDPGNADGVITGRHAPVPAAHVRRELLLEPGPHGGRAPEAGPGGSRRAHPFVSAERGLGRAGRHQHGGAARERRSGAPHGPVCGTDRPAPPHQGSPVPDRHRSGAGEDLPGARHARRAPRLPEHLNG
jgi:hypothetical protein